MTTSYRMKAPYGPQAIDSPLNPGQIKIDGRDNRDRLAFAASYASLILYYNQMDQVSGDWRPFLLKDPAILLAAISKTDYAGIHAQFTDVEVCWGNIRPSDKDDASLGPADIVFVNNLCAVLHNMFVTLNQWFNVMERHHLAFTLHDFLKQKIVADLSGRLWHMASLQQCLSLASFGGIAMPENALYKSFEPDWNRQQGGLCLATGNNDLVAASVADALKSDLAQLTSREMIDALCAIFHAVFDVFMQVIDHAKEAFYKLEIGGQGSPDTALLIAFSKLMELQQSEINQYSQAHLDFYYERVLRQSLLPAKSDQVIVCVTLTDKAASLTLPAGTAFAAGSYPDNAPIVFTNVFQENINQAAIATVDALYYDQKLYLNAIASPDQVVRNQLGEICSWDAFGNNKGVVVQQGFAFASPLLFLQSGTRQITLTLTVAYAGDEATGGPCLDALFSDSQFFLSGEKAWIEVTDYCVLTPSDIVLTLPVSVSPIVAFSANPDGFSSDWPMLKVSLGESVNLTQPLSLQGVTITVKVDELSQFTLANDTSALPSAGPAQIFGPTPEIGGHFYFGSNECFAKPLGALALNMEWDNLPPHLGKYYVDYNLYLAHGLISTAVARTAADTDSTLLPVIFYNTAFTGVWRVLCQQQWIVVTTKAGVAGSSDLVPADTGMDNSVSLFQQNATTGDNGEKVVADPANLQSSIFSFTFDSAFVAVPELMLAPLPVIAAATDGYVRFTLNTPAYAFGNSLYGKLVSYISLLNAQILIKQATPKEDSDAASADSVSGKSAGSAKASGIKKVFSGGLRLLRTIFAKLKSSVTRPTLSANAASVAAQAAATEEAAVTAAAAASVQINSAASDTLPDDVIQMPNLPYCPKLSRLTASYTATSTWIIPSDPADTPNTYPLALFHYGSFTNYLAYDALDAKGRDVGFANLIPKTPTDDLAAPRLALFPGVSGAGCLYVALSGVVAPCTLTLYAQVTTNATALPSDTQNVAYFYWTEPGWQPLSCLQDDTCQLTCSGIITFDIPPLPARLQNRTTLTYEPSPIMPTTDFWLAIAAVAADLVVELSYLDTQALTLTRVAAASLPAGQLPQIAANTIGAAPANMPTIASVAQPFPSFGGLPAEVRSSYVGFSSFYRRVSERLNNKDRASSDVDYVALAHDACIGLFYARVVHARPGVPPNLVPRMVGPGAVCVGLVQQYADAQDSNAFRPIVSGNDQATILRYLTARTSAMATVSVMNLRQQVVFIHATVILTDDANPAAVALELNQRLKLYLSPWISSDLPQMDIEQGIERAGLIDVLTRWPQVTAVSELDIWLKALDSDMVYKTGADPVLPAVDDAILVSAMQHVIHPRRGGGRSTQGRAAAQVRHG